MSIAVIDGPSLQEVHLDEDARALLVGGASDLPGSSRELEEVRKLFPQGAFWRLDGDLSQLQSELSRSRLLHISTHASIPTPRSLSGTLRGDGSATSAFQLSELVFPAGSLAVVAACQSAVDAGTGRDNTSLVSALRTAGADAVVGSMTRPPRPWWDTFMSGFARATRPMSLWHRPSARPRANGPILSTGPDCRLSPVPEEQPH